MQNNTTCKNSEGIVAFDDEFQQTKKETQQKEERRQNIQLYSP